MRNRCHACASVWLPLTLSHHLFPGHAKVLVIREDESWSPVPVSPGGIAYLVRVIREMARTLREMWAYPSGRTALIAVSGVFATGTVFYRIVEGWSWVDSFYFTVVTLTTVGYGDLAPTGAVSKLFTAFLILTGVGAILAFLDFLVSRTWERRRDQGG